MDLLADLSALNLSRAIDEFNEQHDQSLDLTSAVLL
jgi:hypothetical protein